MWLRATVFLTAVFLIVSGKQQQDDWTMWVFLCLFKTIDLTINPVTVHEVGAVPRLFRLLQSLVPKLSPMSWDAKKKKSNHWQRTASRWVTVVIHWAGISGVWRESSSSSTKTCPCLSQHKSSSVRVQVRSGWEGYAVRGERSGQVRPWGTQGIRM